MNLRLWFLLPLTTFKILAADAQILFDPEQFRWTLDNSYIEADFRLTPDQIFVFEQLKDLRTGDRWSAAPGHPSSPIRLQVNDAWFDAQTRFRLVDQSVDDLGSGKRLNLVLQDPAGAGQFTLALEIYDNQRVVRYGLRFRNLSAQTAYVTAADLAAWTFADQQQSYLVFRVNQWHAGPKPDDFQPLTSALKTDGSPINIFSGAHGEQCSWAVVRDHKGRGLFLGWEFDGRATISVRQYADLGLLQVSSSIPDLHHPVDYQGEFQSPAAFLGIFHGGWDEAGYRTQQFAESILAKPPPDPQQFPYVAWDTWAYGTALDENVLRQSADLAASLGIELFIVDLGWSRAIGDWHADPGKFPRGLRALSDYVHSLGMKFGLHFALAEVAPDAPVLQENPDWTTTEEDHYFGAQSLCLAHAPAREWLVGEAVRMIDDYNVDWILQDGENMVKQCTKSTHTHDPADSNYASAVDGLNAAIAAIQQQRPQVSWENCENGGNMMTFNMVRNYVTSITNDASGSLDARRGVYGATYPFPPRYADRYMPEQVLDQYTANSYIFGGPWVLMNRLIEMPPQQLVFAAMEIDTFKRFRRLIAGGRVFHLTPYPAETRIDAIESYNSAADRAVVIVSRAAAQSDSYLLRPRGLHPATRYRVSFESFPQNFLMSGSQLARDGVRLELPAPYTSDVVHLEPEN